MPTSGTAAFSSIRPQLSLDGQIVEVDVLRFTGTERLSGLFEFVVDIAPRDEGFEVERLAIDSLIGKQAVVSIGDQGQEPDRYFHGIVNRSSQLQWGEYPPTNIFRLHIVSWFELWNLNSTSRIFEDRSVLEIIQTVFQDEGKTFRDEIHESYPSRRYCVQFDETNLNFALRLMEEVGIFYFFEHQEHELAMVLADKPSAHPNISGESHLSIPADVQNWRAEQVLHSAEVALTDYDVGAANVLNASETTLNPVAREFSSSERFHYPGEFQNSGEGRNKAKLEMQRMESRHATYHGLSRRSELSAGHRFELEGHLNSEMNRAYILTSVDHAYDLGDGYRNSFSCIPDDPSYPFRPQRTAAKPAVRGPQTATVVDDAHAEEYMAVRVRFHWDRDGNNSCWIRLAEMLAGNEYGTSFIPRVDHEVIVDFLNGDPDQPIITGRVHNGAKPPPNTDADVNLIRTKNGQELRFKDKDGSEELALHAVKDMTIDSETGEIVIQNGSGCQIEITVAGEVKITSPAAVEIESATIKLSAAMVTIDAGLTKASGVLQCGTLITNAVISTSYTPGAGNIW